MPITKEELGRRLSLARERGGLKQRFVAEVLGVSRPAVSQLEAGDRAPNSLQLATMAELYGRDVGEFLAPEFDESEADALAVLFRADPSIGNDLERSEAVRVCVKLCREFANLERLLGLDQDRVFPAAYQVPSPNRVWDAVKQGERLAEIDRDRLHLGSSPIGDMHEVLEPQGVRLLETELPEQVSGILLNDPRFGLALLVNKLHTPTRKLFSAAHEYCHALVDHAERGLVSRQENSRDLREVRANAFAASFLMPAEAVRTQVESAGKGRGSRSLLTAFDEAEVVEGHKREPAGSQELQFYDVAGIADHFGVSYEASVWRLFNLKLVTDPQKDELLEDAALGNEFRRVLGAGEVEKLGRERPDFRQRLLPMALEALRRDQISQGKAIELASLAGVSPREARRLVGTVVERSEPEDSDAAVYVGKGGRWRGEAAAAR